MDGVCFAFGIFYLEFLDYFQENKGKTAWIGSVLNGTYMIMGETSNIEALLAKVGVAEILHKLVADPVFVKEGVNPRRGCFNLVFGKFFLLKVA